METEASTVEARPANELRERPQAVAVWGGEEGGREERVRKEAKRGSTGCVVLPLAAAASGGVGDGGRRASWRGAGGAGSGSLESPLGETTRGSVCYLHSFRNFGH